MRIDEGELVHVERIVWLEDVERLDYVREGIALRAGFYRRGRLGGWGRGSGRCMVGYAVLARSPRSLPIRLPPQS